MDTANAMGSFGRTSLITDRGRTTVRPDHHNIQTHGGKS